MEHERATVARLPVAVEVESEGDDALLAAGRAVEMADVARARWIERVVALEAEGAQAERAVQLEPERFKR